MKIGIDIDDTVMNTFDVIEEAARYFDRYFSDLYSHIDVIIVSSSSNANSIEFETKLEDWKKILK